jgi:hypothetical protein
MKEGFSEPVVLRYYQETAPGGAEKISRREIVKTKRKVLSILVTMSMLICLLVPLATPALAAGDIEALTVPTVTDDLAQTLGTIKVTVPAGSINAGDAVIFKIKGGYDFGEIVPGTQFSTVTNDPTIDNCVYVPAKIADDDNGLLSAEVTVTVLDRNDEVQIVANVDQKLDYDFVFYIYMKDVDIEEGTTDDNVVTFTGPSGTGFPKGTVTNAVVSTEGSVELAVSGADTSNNDFSFDLRIQETIAGSLKNDTESLKLKLPSGYEWAAGVEGNNIEIDALWGDKIIVDIDVDDEELIIDFNGIDQNDDGVVDGDETTVASAWDIAGLFEFTVSDESSVKAGDIKVKITGETDTDITSAVVGTYGDYGVTVSAKDAPTIYAGKDEQEIGDIVIKEDLEGTLVLNRTVTLTLPAGARFQQVYEGAGDLPDFDSDENLDLDFDAFTGTDERTAKFKVTSQSDDAAEIDLEDVEVAVEAGFTGDLVVTVGGSAGVSGEVVVAKVVAPITGAAVSVPNVIIGLGGQIGGSFTLTEATAEVFDKDGVTATYPDGTVILDLPGGLTFTKTPKAEVTSGDLRIGNVRRVNGDNSVAFEIESESSEPSTITVSDVVLKLDRTVAEGDITLKVQGGAVCETQRYESWTNSDSAAKFAIAKVVTPAPGETKYTTVFKIGDMSYTVNGVAATADVAPYIKGDRTMLPIRYAALAAGVLESNIFWNGADQSVILIKGDRIVKLVIGSTTMTINGVAFPMDAAPEVVDPGRTMLPLRAVAQALGCDVAWDAATQAVTITQSVTVQ